jgi:hypothetical protein
LQKGESPAWVRAEPEWAGALHLLSSPLLRNKECLCAVAFDGRRIDFPGLAERAAAWSHGERIRLCAAWALFNGGDRTAFAGLLDGDLLSEAVGTLSGANVRRPIEAVRLRRPEADPL